MNIEGYDNYLVFEDGSIVNSKTGRAMKPSIHISGYLMHGLSKNNIKKNFRVHRLIAKAYIPNPDNKPCVDHINRIRTDNRVENLRWATYLENSQNQGEYNTNTSGTKNVRYDEVKDRWIYIKTVNKKLHHKSFKTEEEAIAYKNNYESLDSCDDDNK